MKYFLIILLAFTIIRALIVTYIYYIWMVEILCNGVVLCIFPNSMFSDITLVAKNVPYWEDLHQRNCQTLQTEALFLPREPIVEHLPVDP